MDHPIGDMRRDVSAQKARGDHTAPNKLGGLLLIDCEACCATGQGGIMCRPSTIIGTCRIPTTATYEIYRGRMRDIGIYIFFASNE